MTTTLNLEQVQQIHDHGWADVIDRAAISKDELLALCTLAMAALQHGGKFAVNIRDGKIVGSDGPDVPNGSYVLIDNLPSEGGEFWKGRKQSHPNHVIAQEGYDHREHDQYGEGDLS